MKPAGITNKRKQAVSSSSNVAQMSPSAASSWPSEKLPVELFSIIISFLPRSSIQNMRLVNREFERKVSEYLFRVVVVPFRPEIYGIHPEPLQGQEVEAIEEDVRRGSIMLQDKGMRVFEGFGRHILRFAMSMSCLSSDLLQLNILQVLNSMKLSWLDPQSKVTRKLSPRSGVSIAGHSRNTIDMRSLKD